MQTLLGLIGMAAVPKIYFGIFELFSVFSVAGFTALLGMSVFRFPSSFKIWKTLLKEN